MKIVDLAGHEIATYDQARVDGKPKSDSLGSAFACYTANPQRFTFLTSRDGDRIEIRAAEGARFLATPEDVSSQLSLSGIMHSLESSVAGESPAATYPM